MRGYGQYCPIARAAEIFAERWTPIIVRNLLLGCETFTEIQRGAPGIPKSLLTQRLRQLERLGIVERHGADGRAPRYRPTPAGRELWDVCVALGTWGARWLEVAPEHLDPYVALWSMCNSLNVERLPPRRVVVRFEFRGVGARRTPMWLVLDRGEGEVCVTHPGFEEDLVLRADAEWFVRWHMGHASWSTAATEGRFEFDGPSRLARSFPSWNLRSHFADVRPVLTTR